MAALGYAAHGPLGSGRFGRWQRRYRCELQMVCAHPDRRGLLVELHWSLVELPYYVERIPMAEVWATTRPAEGLPGASIPDPATLLLHGCAHVSLHHSRALRLIWLVDVDRLARSAALDWDALIERSARWGLGLAAHTTLKVDRRLARHAAARGSDGAAGPAGRRSGAPRDVGAGRRGAGRGAAPGASHLDGLQRAPAAALRRLDGVARADPAVRGHAAHRRGDTPPPPTAATESDHAPATGAVP